VDVGAADAGAADADEDVVDTVFGLGYILEPEAAFGARLNECSHGSPERKCLYEGKGFRGCRRNVGALRGYLDGRGCGAENTGTMPIQKCGTLCVLAASALFILLGMMGTGARAQSTAAQAEKDAKRALDAASVTAFDASMTYVSQDVIAKPVNGSAHEITYTITGPGAGVKSSVEYRVYDNPAEAAKHADPDMAQQQLESDEFDMPRGRFRAYHSNLTGSALAQDVPQTFHCKALNGHTAWSRCYYYGGGKSDIVVVGTTTSATANEAILITAMGAQSLATLKP
jgi:hypothetical protein